MRAGTLRHRVTIRQPVTAENTYGEEAPASPTLVATRWASINQIGGGERTDAEQIVVGATYEIKFRHVAGITTAMYVEFGSRRFHILSARNPDERGDDWILTAAEDLEP